MRCHRRQGFCRIGEHPLAVETGKPLTHGPRHRGEQPLLGQPADRRNLQVAMQEMVIAGKAHAFNCALDQVSLQQFSRPDAAMQPLVRHRDQVGFKRGVEENRARPGAQRHQQVGKRIDHVRWLDDHRLAGGERPAKQARGGIGRAGYGTRIGTAPAKTDHVVQRLRLAQPHGDARLR